MSPYELFAVSFALIGVLLLGVTAGYYALVALKRAQNTPSYTPYAEDVIPQSFVSGVSYDQRKELWRVRFRVDGVRKHFGYFDKQEEAETHCLAARGNKYGVINS